MYKVISFGHRCTSSGFIKHLGLKTESYPFDWLISKLDVIKDCIETKFIHFVDLNNYIIKKTETYNLIDNIKNHICYEDTHINIFYENYNNNTPTYHYKLAINHNFLIDHSEESQYYKRCIKRLYELLNLDIHKYYIYIHQLMGINDFYNNEKSILYEFDDFNQFIKNKTKNIFGLYFILIKYDENIKSFKLKEEDFYDVFVIFCNNNFLDTGPQFYGECNLENKEILKILKRYFV